MELSCGGALCMTELWSSWGRELNYLLWLAVPAGHTCLTWTDLLSDASLSGGPAPLQRGFGSSFGTRFRPLSLRDSFSLPVRRSGPGLGPVTVPVLRFGPGPGSVHGSCGSSGRGGGPGGDPLPGEWRGCRALVFLLGGFSDAVFALPHHLLLLLLPLLTG